MDKAFMKNAGISLLSGAFLLIFTMVLHPSGGSIERILKIQNLIVGAHGLAIFSLPFVAFGFYGLSAALATKGRLSWLAFCMLCFSLVAAMIAAAVNGLVLPMFLNRNAEMIAQNPALVKTILSYGTALNHAMDYVLIGGLLGSMGIWSALMLRNNSFSKGLGYYGLLLLGVAMVGLALQFNFVNLWGFRVFVWSIASWIAGVSISMIRTA